MTMGTVHELKTWPAYFKPVSEGRKSFEVRRADREFAVGDILRLREYDPTLKDYSGAECTARVVYLMVSEDHPGIRFGFVVMGIELESATWARPAPENEPEGITAGELAGWVIGCPAALVCSYVVVSWLRGVFGF